MTDDEVLLRLLDDDPKAQRAALVLLLHRQTDLTKELKTITHRIEAIAQTSTLLDTETRDLLAQTITEQRILKEKLAHTMTNVDLIHDRMYKQQGEREWTSTLARWVVKRWYIALPVAIAVIAAIIRLGLLPEIISLFG